jgi:hypothetical protein
VIRTDNAQGIRASNAQATVTWGGRQGVQVDFAGPGTLFGGANVPPGFGIPNLNNIDQLVDMRYERPTTWAVNLFCEIVGFAPNIGDQIRVLWDVFISVGKASNRIQLATSFSKTAVPIAPAAQSTLLALQIAAQTIQIIPNALSVTVAGGGAQTQSYGWSAWIAPVVD